MISSDCKFDDDFDELENVEVNNTFTVLSPEEIVKHKEDIVREANEFFPDIPSETICALLNYVKWDFEYLVSQLYDNPDKLFKDARVVNLATMQQENQGSRKSIFIECMKCSICFAYSPVSRISGLKCGHQCCDNCWSEYFRENILEKGRGQGLTCLGYQCDVLVDNEIIMRLAAPNVTAKYQYLLSDSFVKCSKYLTNCPAPGCQYVIKIEQSESCKVICKCGRVFCFACSEIWHDPIDCTLFKKWLKECSDDLGTAKYISTYTKECPKCKTAIEKMGGCNHMLCSEPQCQYNFCWICLQEWDTHIRNKCQIPIEDRSIAKTDSHKAMKRYLRFYNYYMSHQQSLDKECEMLPSNIQDRRYELNSKYKIRFLDTEFIDNAMHVLRQCRETLMVTYIFAYYVDRNNHSMIFEDNQSFLQNATEALSGYLEELKTSDDLETLMKMTLNKTSYCAKLRKTLMEHVHEGYTKEWWQFTK